jgi:hypothetical protein
MLHDTIGDEQNEKPVFEFDIEPEKMDDMPTAARPGSAEKVAVLKRRFEANQFLYHPNDAANPMPQQGRR